MSQTPCIYCGHPAEQRDHIVSRWAGGGDEPSNIAPACGSCNAAKGNRSAEHFLRDHPEVLARVRAHLAGADVLSMLKPGEKPRAESEDPTMITTSLRIKRELLADLKGLALQRRCSVNDLLVQGAEDLLALNGRRAAA